MNLKKISVLIAAIVLTISCSRQKKMIDTPSILIPGAKNLSEKQVRKAIIKAGQKRQWNCSSKAPGVVLCIYNARKSSATVKVLHNSDQFTIQYVSSINLKEKNGKIHPKYNQWVSNLRTDITAKISEAHEE
jgi:accessory colonization factor AcfC